jgi:hypothetical protein
MHCMAIKMKPADKGEKPDYMAMANMLVQIANELRQKTTGQSTHSDVKQAERLEQIAENIKASIT